jgi:hypothetical protein
MIMYVLKLNWRRTVAIVRKKRIQKRRREKKKETKKKNYIFSFLNRYKKACII